jgi:hypothetical protein
MLRFGLTVAGLCMAYIPVRLLASRYCTVLTSSWPEGADGFAYPGAVVIWPLYVFLTMGLAFFVGSLERIWAAFRVLVGFGLAVWICETWRLDNWMGITDGGRTGLTEGLGGPGSYNSTVLSQRLCVVAFIVGIALGETLGRVLKAARQRRIQGTLDQVPPAPS